MEQFHPYAVLHFAAYALVGESMCNPMMYYQNNIVGGLNLLDAMMRTACKRIILSSTCATYGDPEQFPITETTPQKPTNPYGHSKLVIEQILDWNRVINGIEPTYLRYFNACGAVGSLGEYHDPETHLIPNALKVALGEQSVAEIFGNDYPTPDGTCIRDYIHIRDLADAHVLALEKAKTGAYNLGTGVGVSVQEVIDSCQRITGRPIPVRYLPRRPGDPAILVASGDKAKRELNWEPKYSNIDQIISDAWAYHSKKS